MSNPTEPKTIPTPTDPDVTKSEPSSEDEEDHLFSAIESTEAASAALKTEQASGHDAAAAPTLLKDAITKGEVDVDESEAEEEKEEEKKGEEHVHHRVSLRGCLSFCLVDFRWRDLIGVCRGNICICLSYCGVDLSNGDS